MTSHPNGSAPLAVVPTVPPVPVTAPVPAGGTPGVAGPLSQAVAEATARATRSRLDHEPRRTWEHAAGGQPTAVPKRLLVAVSHAIEKAVVSCPIPGTADGTPPTVVLALFQRLEFFERERVVYERLAEAGAEVVVGFVRGEEHSPPRGVHTVLLEPDEKLADEWTVVAVGPRAGAFLVATDQHAYDAHEHGTEAGRRFSGRWGYAHAQAGAELARLRLALGSRLPDPLLRSIDTLLGEVMASGGEVAGSAGTPGEAWATASLAHMITRMQTAQAGSRALREQLADAHRAADAHRSADVDPSSGLPTPDFLERWSTPGGSTELPVGLALVDVAGLDPSVGRRSGAELDPSVGRRSGAELDPVVEDPRAEYHAARKVAAALGQPLGPVDAAVRLSRREFLVVVPGASPRHLAGLGDEVAEQLELASDGYPHIPLTAAVATIVTHTRPLPVEDLRAALSRLPADATGAVDAGRTVAGERIAVVSTRAGRVLPGPGRHEPEQTAPEAPETRPFATVAADHPWFGPDGQHPDDLLPGSHGVAAAGVPHPRS
ncbi:DICT sensory domain-containing protein [Actinomycetospora lemnae]|uniref:DICT sensory domain-containing protein n=1 Tax=Actinomycetospora lemnae TaxID=3019891 RepID=A0ABT5T0K4_9PSEU|nr:DICT sensory domain-containing protein [Actinomycetospora sp. DW7H6]MDD7968648.1 DICT sensory domain-containing protein [Actinomycetospora sp. DW7H6]